MRAGSTVHSLEHVYDIKYRWDRAGESLSLGADSKT